MSSRNSEGDSAEAKPVGRTIRERAPSGWSPAALLDSGRSSGILLHPTSLPGAGIGDLGEPAYRFVDWLESTGCTLWQVLPLGPTGYGDSPYQCFSAFAGNPYLISFDGRGAHVLWRRCNLPGGQLRPNPRAC